MAALAPDRNLLFGLLALQNGLIHQGQLVAAFQAWTLDKARALADHLVGRGDLDADDRSVVEALVAHHLKKSGGDAEKSLAALPTGRSTRAKLAGLGDPQIDASLAHVGSSSTLHSEDVDRTASSGVGAATSDGQRFRVLRPHAQGGLGAVFVALDGELHREVALKQILDHHADDPVSRRRFLLEAEITGGLEHPGVVPVYGLGSYGDGRPYYAMRFIKGDSLKRAIERFHTDEMLKANPGRRSLELRQLLRRFIDVCNAIEYAHSRGVLHRDIKPSNVILGKYGETLVVDWGLAKATGQSEPGAEERTLIPSSASGSAETLPGSALGTPAYMSPEQARGDLEHLGPRSDVYSLGATLYCLLTGEPPQEGDDIGELLRRVQRGEFPRPRQSNASIDPALEAICLKAMALDPEDRYASERRLASDIERWMADEPVTAWAEPWTRPLLRWLSRHRTGMTGAAAAVLAGVVGLSAVLAVQTRANGRLQRAYDDLANANSVITKANADLKSANERETQRFDLAMEAIKLFHGDVTEDLLLKEKPFAGLRSRLLTGAAAFYSKLERLLAGQSDPVARRALGHAYFELAELTYDIGNMAEAIAVHRKGLEVRRELAGRPGADADAGLDVARSLIRLGNSLDDVNDNAGALVALEDAVKAAEGAVAASRGSDEARLVLADCLSRLALVVGRRRPEDGLATSRRALLILRELVAKDPSDTRYMESLGACCLWIADLSIDQNDQNRIPEEIAGYEEAVAIYTRLVGARPGAYRLQDLLAKIHNNMGGTLWDLGRRAEAIASIRRAAAIWSEVADANPAVSVLANNAGHAFNNLGLMLIEIGRPAEALGMLADGRPFLRRIAETDPGVLYYRSNLARNLSLTGTALARIGRWREAHESFEKAHGLWQRLVEEDTSINYIQSRFAESLSTFGENLRLARRLTEAASVYRREKAIWERLVASEATDGSYRAALANCESHTSTVLVALGRPADARACSGRAIAMWQDLIRSNPGDANFAQGLAESLMRSGSVRAAAGDARGAVAEWRKAAALFEGHPPSGDLAILRACCHGSLAGLAGEVGSGISAAERASHAEEAMAILRREAAAGYYNIDLIRVEPGLDPVRPRDDFRRLIMDLCFPVEPFAVGVDLDFRPLPAPR
jgi:serine/threonine-protein kinase